MVAKSAKSSSYLIKRKFLSRGYYDLTINPEGGGEGVYSLELLDPV